MQVGLNVDASRLLLRLRNPEKRIAFAIDNSLNDTIKVAQRAVQLHVQDEFEIRKPTFFFGGAAGGGRGGAAARVEFASVRKGRHYAEIAVGRFRRLLLPLFERGGLREPFKGKESVAVPVEARATKSASIPEELFVQRLAFRRPKATTVETRRARSQRSRGKVWEGKLGSYLIPRMGIFQRVTAAVSRVLYVFARPFQIPPGRLKFVETVHGVARRVFPESLHRHVRETLEFHARRGGRR